MPAPEAATAALPADAAKPRRDWRAEKAQAARIALRRRRLWRWTLLACVALIALASLLDHLGRFGYTGDDFAAFNRRECEVVQVNDDCTIVVRSPVGPRRVVTLRMIGVYAPTAGEQGAGDCVAQVRAMTVGKRVIVKLLSPRGRDAQGRLPAYVYLTTSHLLNQELIRDGFAYADRREAHPFAGVFGTTESDARKHLRGLWRGLHSSGEPAWRREWFSRATSEGTEE